MKPYSPEDRQRCEEALDGLMEKTRAAALALSVVSSQSGTLYRYEKGDRDRKNRLSVNQDTLFGIASLTKSFVCLGLMKMREEGRLTLSDRLSSHIPEYHGIHTDPALSHLMSHAGGFYPRKRLTVPELRGKGGFPAGDEYREASFLDAARAEVAEALDRQDFPLGLNGEPGRHFSYCNDGFGLLGEVIRLEGEGGSLEEYLKSRLFSPLEMKRTTFSLDPEGENAACLYSGEDPLGEGNTDYRNNAFCLPGAGGIKSCVRDMEHLLQFYLQQGTWGGNRLLSRESMLEMTAPRIMTPRGAYGYGLEMSGMEGYPVFGHGGSLPGVSSCMLICPARDLACIALCNTEGVPVSFAARTALRLCASLSPVEHPPVLPDLPWSACCPGTAAGVYGGGEEEAVTVAISGHQLTLDGRPLCFTGRHSAVIRRAYADTPVLFHPHRNGRIFAMTLGSRMLPKLNRGGRL